MRTQAQHGSGADLVAKDPASRRRAASPPLLALQQAAGNAAVTRAVQRTRDGSGERGERRGSARGGHGGSPVRRVVQRVEQPGPAATTSQSATERLAQLLVGGGEQAKDKQVGKVLHKRVRSGPMFSGTELDAIEAVAAENTKWLKNVGLCSRAEARKFLDAADYHTWLEQPEGMRLLVTTLVWEDHVKGKKAPPETPTPPYQLAHYMARHSGETPQEEKDQLTAERDEQITQNMVKTLDPPGIKGDGDEAKEFRRRTERGTELLTKIFLLLRRGLKVFNPQEEVHEDFKGEVAHALAYGGRVNIRIPQLADGQHGYELPQWLHITKEKRKPLEPLSTPDAPVVRRKFGTHHMSIEDNQGAEGERGAFVEKGGLKASLTNAVDPHTHLYGLATGIGGAGNKDYHGDTIRPNESYGHVFMGYKPPTKKRDGALEVGIETAGPGGRTPDGYEHTITSSEKNNNPVSQFGGHKDDKPGGDAPLESNQRYVDLKEFGDWVAELKTLEDQWNSELGRAKTPEQRKALYRRLIGPRENLT